MSAVPMPPLPTEGGGTERLEEPHPIGNDGRSSGSYFSPHNTMVRNPSIATSVITVRTGDQVTNMSGITGSTDQVAREGLMLRSYSDVASSHEITSYDKTNIKDTAKKHMLHIVKFVLSSDTRKYPSFWQPNLLNDTPHYVDAFFDSYGNRYKDRRTHDIVLVDAVRLWKAAAPRFKKYVDNHRAGVAQRMKSDIITGGFMKCILYITNPVVVD
jgi:hypothetical protein